MTLYSNEFFPLYVIYFAPLRPPNCCVVDHFDLLLPLKITFLPISIFQISVNGSHESFVLITPLLPTQASVFYCQNQGRKKNRINRTEINRYPSSVFSFLGSVMNRLSVTFHTWTNLAARRRLINPI